ncbi:MAG: L-glyceraldehyde 3-phosphate reductase [Treponema sp.]|jgi:L-glyceraldehyde 3-phosphate reductase|nr:L-glyceraldehyde 3-phosphate reductase [Treponema sp.]
MYIANENRYGDMLYRRCGRSGIQLPFLSLGLWHSFGDNKPYAAMREMVLGAFDLGITHFDIANNYGPPPGSAEINFGRILKEDLAPYRDELIISTKAGYNMWPGPYGEWGSRKYLLSSLDQSLKRLGLEYVDIFYHHRPDPNTPLEETMYALSSAVTQGKALYVGISNYQAADTKRASDILKSLGIHCLIHQPSYNMFNRWVEQDLLEVLAAEGIGCIAFSTLAQGLLTNRYFDGIPKGSRADGNSVFLTRDKVTEEKVDKARQLDKLAQRRGQTLSQMVLAWNLRSPAMTSLVIGASGLTQIQENLEARHNLNFSETELAEIDAILGTVI